jgi:hypothetical protein
VNSSTNSRARRVSTAISRSAGISISTLKWPGVGEDRAVLHPLHVLARDHVLVAGRRAEQVADLRRPLERQHLEARPSTPRALSADRPR